MKKRRALDVWVLAATLCGLAPAAAHAATVLNLALDEGPDQVVLTYDLEADGPCRVRLVGSGDDGETFALNIRSVEGDVGPEVPPGTGRRVVWRFLADYPAGLAALDVVLEVVAEEDDGGPPEEEAEAVDEEEVDACLNGPFDAACEAAFLEMGRGGHLGLLLDELGHPDPRVRGGLARVLGALGDRRAVGALLDLLEDTPLPTGDNTVKVREKREIQVAETRVRERYGTVRNR